MAAIGTEDEARVVSKQDLAEFASKYNFKKEIIFEASEKIDTNVTQAFGAAARLGFKHISGDVPKERSKISKKKEKKSKVETNPRQTFEIEAEAKTESKIMRRKNFEKLMENEDPEIKTTNDLWKAASKTHKGTNES